MERENILKNVADKEKVSGIVWLIIGILQVIVGIYIAYWTLFVGIWNVIIGIMRISNAQNIEQRGNKIVEEYEKSLTSIIIFIIINLLIGGVIGIIGAIFDILTRNYVLNNKNIILGKESANYTTSNSKYEDLEKLQKLKDSGILTQAEFETEKQKILK